MMNQTFNYGTCFDKLIDQRLHLGVDKNLSFIKNSIGSPSKNKALTEKELLEKQ